MSSGLLSHQMLMCFILIRLSFVPCRHYTIVLPCPSPLCRAVCQGYGPQNVIYRGREKLCHNNDNDIDITIIVIMSCLIILGCALSGQSYYKGSYLVYIQSIYLQTKIYFLTQGSVAIFVAIRGENAGELPNGHFYAVACVVSRDN